MADGAPPLPPGAHDDLTSQIYASCIPLTILCTVAVVLRFVARRMAKANLWWDDWLIVVALALYIGLSGTALAAAARWGLARHIAILDPVKQVIPFLKSLLAYQILYFATQAAIKLSLLALYFRLFNPSSAFRIVCYGMAGLVVAWFVAMFFATLFNCVPIDFFWNKTRPGEGVCVDFLLFAYGNGITNLLLDVMVLCLPFLQIYRLNIDTRVKIPLGGIFVLGFFVCAVSVIRISSIAAFGPGNDPTWSATGMYVWSQVEPSCGIIGACLPTMSPLMRRALPHRTANASSSGRTWGDAKHASSKCDKRGHDVNGGSRFSRLDRSPDGPGEDERPIALESVEHGRVPRGVVTRIDGPASHDTSPGQSRDPSVHAVGKDVGIGDGSIYVHHTISQV